VEGVSWRGYGNAEAHVEWNEMDMDPHYGSIYGFRGMDLNPVNLGTGAISWSSKRQRTVALSSCEAEYMGQTATAKEAAWLRGLLQELLKEYREVPELKTTVIFGDNQGAIAISKNPQFHTRTKHIDIQNHYCREKVNDGTVEFQYIPTGKQVADGLTKALPKDRLILFRKAQGLKERRP
jgi:hypothetical protein